MIRLLAVALLSVVPREDVIAERADVLYLEHFYDGEGRLVFTQLCPLDWNPHHERWDYVCFRLEKYAGNLRPERDWIRGGYVVRFMDGEIPRVIRADSFREDWVQEDSELAHRAVLCKEKRRELIKGWADPYRPPFAAQGE